MIVVFFPLYENTCRYEYLLIELIHEKGTLYWH